MKNNSSKFLVLFMLTAMLASCKKEFNKTVTVVRDCTGTYLRWDEKDYQVCNLEKVSSFSDGVTVTATFKKLDECNGSASLQPVCERYHANEGWIEVDKIK